MCVSQPSKMPCLLLQSCVAAALARARGPTAWHACTALKRPACPALCAGTLPPDWGRQGWTYNGTYDDTHKLQQL